MNREVLFFVIIAMFIVGVGTIVIQSYNNNMELSLCKYNSYYHNVLFEDNLIFDKCLIIGAGGEELTLDEYKDRHKYDGIEVRK